MERNVHEKASVSNLCTENYHVLSEYHTPSSHINDESHYHSCEKVEGSY